MADKPDRTEESRFDDQLRSDGWEPCPFEVGCITWIKPDDTVGLETHRREWHPAPTLMNEENAQLETPVQLSQALAEASQALSTAHQLASERVGDKSGLNGPTRDLIYGLNTAIDALKGLVDDVVIEQMERDGTDIVDIEVWHTYINRMEHMLCAEFHGGRWPDCDSADHMQGRAFLSTRGKT